MDEHPTKLEISQTTELCCAVGHVVVQWGFVEHNLNFCLAVIYFKYGGKNILKDHKFPKFLKRQIRFLRDSFKELDSLIPFKDDGLSLIDRVDALSKKRDEIIHSTYAGPSALNSFDFKRFDFSIPQGLSMSDIKHTIPAILDARKKIEVLASDLIYFYFRLEGRPVP